MMAFYDTDIRVMKPYLKSLYSIMEANNENKKKDKIYFAAPWFTEKSKAIYDYVEDIAKLYDYNDYIVFPREITDDSKDELFSRDIEAIQQCDYVLAFISERDMGTAFEMGYAFGHLKPIVLLVYDDSDLESKTNLMLAKCADSYVTIENLYCLFLTHMGGTHTINIAEDDIE